MIQQKYSDKIIGNLQKSFDGGAKVQVTLGWTNEQHLNELGFVKYQN